MLAVVVLSREYDITQLMIWFHVCHCHNNAMTWSLVYIMIYPSHEKSETVFYCVYELFTKTTRPQLAFWLVNVIHHQPDDALTSKYQTDSLSGCSRAGNHVFFSADHILTRNTNRGYYWLQPKLLQMLVVARHRNQRSEHVPSRNWSAQFSAQKKCTIWYIYGYTS